MPKRGVLHSSLGKAQRRVEPIAVGPANEPCIVVSHLHGKNRLSNVGSRFHEFNDERDIGLLIFGKIERKKQAHRVLCGIKRRNGRFEIPLDTLLGKLDSVIEPVDKTALYSASEQRSQ